VINEAYLTSGGAYNLFNISSGGVNVGIPYHGTPLNVLSYNTQLDNVRLQDILLQCGMDNCDDYRENQKHCVDTCYLNKYVYNQNWFHRDKFYEESKTIIDDSNLNSGLSLRVERKYDILATTSNTQLTWYTFAICQKMLHIGSDMIQFM
jgi:hypothetical protein